MDRYIALRAPLSHSGNAGCSFRRCRNISAGNLTRLWMLLHELDGCGAPRERFASEGTRPSISIKNTRSLHNTIALQFREK